ncbi:hypothetical protein JD844_025724 [Phrynosoma platyrhinos]|uniref:Uncharacterized protein n=1 Tax=Phrynosoma platyrhinos TaxID=52577 RepID=A0ABQ7SZJ6_PHRPL|nr:hypothetical protein JD844_025724 [Phrynosoma platyrhinos]
MKCLCVLFAIAIFCGIQADDAELDQEAKQETLQTLAESQGGDQAVLDAYDDAVEDLSDGKESMGLFETGKRVDVS